MRNRDTVACMLHTQLNQREAHTSRLLQVDEHADRSRYATPFSTIWYAGNPLKHLIKRLLIKVSKSPCSWGAYVRVWREILRSTWREIVQSDCFLFTLWSIIFVAHIVQPTCSRVVLCCSLPFSLYLQEPGLTLFPKCKLTASLE